MAAAPGIPGRLAAALNKAHEAILLSDAEFEVTFGMGKDAFYELKQWKQRELKKRAGLF